MADRRKADPERKCVLTGEIKRQEHLLRLVEGPEGTLFADVANKLPGRGVWVTAERHLIEAAIADKSFIRAVSRSLKKGIKGSDIPDGLCDLVEMLVAKRVLDRLGLEKGAGRVITGSEKARAVLKDVRTPVAMVFQAGDASLDGRGKIASLAKVTGVDVVDCFDRDELSLALGRENVVHAVLVAGGVMDRLEADLVRLAGFRKNPEMKDEE